MRGSLFITLTSFLSRLGEGEDEGAFELGTLTSVLSQWERKALD